MQNFLYLSFFLLISAELTAAEPVAEIDIKTVTSEQKKEWGCPLCAQCISIDKTTRLNDAQISFYCQPLQSTFTDSLVLIKTDAATWKVAVIISSHISTDNTLNVHMCENHTSCTKNIREIQEPLPYWRYQWQHRIPLQAIYAQLQRYIATYKKDYAHPFAQAKIIEPTDSIKAIGDLHGDPKSLRYSLQEWYTSNPPVIDARCKLAPGQHAVCLGDYADRGKRGAEVWYMLITLKLINRDRFFLAKGNHETPLLTKNSEFFAELQAITPDASPQEQMILLRTLFNTLPHTVILGQRPTESTMSSHPYSFIMFAHGGPDLYISLHEAIAAAIQADSPGNPNKLIEHPIINGKNHYSGLLWSDIQANEPGVNTTVIKDSRRGEGMYTFNYAATAKFLEEQSHDSYYKPYIVQSLFRGHEHIPGGIACLLKTCVNDMHWRPLESGKTEYIERNSVYTCTSSPEGAGGFGCFEDSYASIEWDSAIRQWLVTAHIQHRIPKRWISVDLQHMQ